MASTHPPGHNLTGLPIPPQAAAAAAALNSLSRFGLNGSPTGGPSGGGGGGGGGAQMPGGAGGGAAPLPPPLQQFLQLHFQGLATPSLNGPGKPPLGVIPPPSSAMSMLSSNGSHTSSASSNDENRIAAKRSLLSAMPPLSSSSGLDLDMPLRMSTPSSLSMSTMLAPLTLDVGSGPFNENLRLQGKEGGSPPGAASGASSVSTGAAAANPAASLPPPRGVHPMILSGHHLRCSMCDRHFDNAAKLHLHMRSHETEDGQKICLVCKKTFNCASALKIHYRRHSGEREGKGGGGDGKRLTRFLTTVALHTLLCCFNVALVTRGCSGGSTVGQWAELAGS